MPTVFETLFPSLSIQSCISPAIGSSSGPRYEALEKETGELFEVRCVSIDDAVEGRLSACRARGVALLSAKNRALQGPCTFPDDYYCTTLSPVGHAERAVLDQTAAAPLDRMAFIVSVTRRLGPSLWDIARTGSPGSPAILPLVSFLHLMDCVSAFCRIHATLPTHANLTPNAFVLTTCDRRCSEWSVSDWCLDAAAAAKDDARATTAPDKIRRWEKQCLRSLASVFCPSLTWPRGRCHPDMFIVGLTAVRHTAKSSHARLRSGVVVIQPSGDLLDETEAERYLVHAVCQIQARRSASPPSTSLQYVLADDTSDSDDSPRSLHQRADEHARMLATERAVLLEDARRASSGEIDGAGNAPSIHEDVAALQRPRLAGNTLAALPLDDRKRRPPNCESQASSVDDERFYEPHDISQHRAPPPLPSLSQQNSSSGRRRPHPPRRPPPRPDSEPREGDEILLQHSSTMRPLVDASPPPVAGTSRVSVPFGGASPPKYRPVRASSINASRAVVAGRAASPRSPPSHLGGNSGVSLEKQRCCTIS